MTPSLDTLSAAETAAKIINQTNKPVFLTGKAGTGKTTFLRHIIEHTHKNAIIVAPTGIAAINAGGVTIHSQFGIPFGAFIPDSNFKFDNAYLKINTPHSLIKHLNMREQKRRVLQELELLIIDEVSMLRADILDTIDLVLKTIRKQTHKPFGGVQVLFIGDLMQLPPIVKDDEWNILRQYYNSIYFFDAKVLSHNKPVLIELDKIYRQTDTTFIDLLNNLRNNAVTQANIDLLNSYYNPNFDATKSLNTITLTTHNNIADNKNKQALQSLSGKSYFFNAAVNGEFNESAFPVEGTLELKVGAQIMFIKNDISGKQLYFNGKIGIVSKLNDKEIEVDFNDGSKPFFVENYKWENIKYDLNPATNEIEENIVGDFVHYPIKLAWAITVHKSQGLTFEKAILDINRAFAPGQVYVALSRLKSLDGLVLTSPIQFNVISQDKLLMDYTVNKSPLTEIQQLIGNETKLFLKNMLLKAYDFNWLFISLTYHANSYTATENKSAKQRHEDWAKSLLEKIEPLKLNADKFMNQVLGIFENQSNEYLQTIEVRNNSAKNYFYPPLKEISKTILIHIEKLKDEKQVKTYLTELLELESIVYKQLIYIDKVTYCIDAINHNKTFDKRDFKNSFNQNERLELVKQSAVDAQKADAESFSLKSKISKNSSSSKKPSSKKEKPDTKVLTFELYKVGKTIIEIAQERSLTVNTIEKHLHHYISLGLIPVTNFITQAKHEYILSERTKLDNTNSTTQLKAVLGDEYTYSDISFSLATQKLL